MIILKKNHMNVEMVITTLRLNLQGLTCLFDYAFIQKHSTLLYTIIIRLTINI
jgi:hypothetical protein